MGWSVCVKRGKGVKVKLAGASADSMDRPGSSNYIQAEVKMSESSNAGIHVTLKN